jgi:hypothetical protein
MSNETEKSLRDELSESMSAVQERLRDEQGRFAKHEAEEVPHDPVDTPADPPPTEPVGKVEDKSQVVPKIEEDPFPQSWKKDYAKHWSTLPPDLKKYIREHEEQTRASLVKQDEDRLTGKQLRELINPYLPSIQAQGMTVQQAFQGMLQQNFILRHGTPQEKRDLLLNAAKIYGIDISQPAETQQGWVDPQVAALQQQLAELRNWQQQLTVSAQQQEKASIDSTIAEFASAPGHEHFQKVSYIMGSLLQGGQARDLEDAYQKAIWADPELRLTLLAAQQAETEAKRAAEAKAKATAARNASGSVRGSSSGIASATPSAPKGSLREELRAAFAASKDR